MEYGNYDYNIPYQFINVPVGTTNDEKNPAKIHQLPEKGILADG
jgi:hypothetical protein